MGNRSKYTEPVCTIMQVKQEINELVNCRVRIYNGISKKYKPIEGTIIAAYNNLFVLQMDNSAKKTYTYSELITGGIKAEKI